MEINLIYLSVIISLVANRALDGIMSSNILVSSTIHMAYVHSYEAHATMLESKALNNTNITVTCLELASICCVESYDHSK